MSAPDSVAALPICPACKREKGFYDRCPLCGHEERHYEKKQVSAHKEPWLFDGGVIRDAAHEPVFAVETRNEREDACAAHAVACVNACAGLNPAALGDLVKACEDAFRQVWEECEMGYIVDTGAVIECGQCGAKGKRGIPVKHEPECIQGMIEPAMNALTALRNQQPS